MVALRPDEPYAEKLQISRTSGTFLITGEDGLSGKQTKHNDFALLRV